MGKSPGHFSLLVISVGGLSPLWVVPSGLLVLGSLRKPAEQDLRSKPVSSTPLASVSVPASKFLP